MFFGLITVKFSIYWCLIVRNCILLHMWLLADQHKPSKKIRRLAKKTGCFKLFCLSSYSRWRVSSCWVKIKLPAERTCCERLYYTLKNMFNVFFHWEKKKSLSICVPLLIFLVETAAAWLLKHVFSSVGWNVTHSSSSFIDLLNPSAYLQVITLSDWPFTDVVKEFPHHSSYKINQSQIALLRWI